MGEWSLMGGFVQEDESVDDAAKRVLNELTGLDRCIYGTSPSSFGAIDRDPGERVVSIVYYCAHQHQRIRQRIRYSNTMHFWVNINELPALIFRPSANGSAGTEADAAEGLYRANRL